MNWPIHRLEDLTEPTRPITYGVVKPGPEDDIRGVRFIRGGDIFEGRLTVENLRTITQDVSRTYSRTLLRGGELVVSLVGNPGHVAVVPKSLAGANLARQAGLIALRNGIDANFIKFYLMSPIGRAGLFAQMTGSVQTVINLANLRGVRVPLPPLSVQQRIAGILSTYDELIENSQRRIKILESMARALYREWFVHFRFPGHENHPRVASPLGEIPQGWEVKKLSTVAEVNRAQINTRSAPEELHYIDISSVSPGQIENVTTYAFADAPGRARRIVQHGDVLWSCVRPNRRSYAQVMQPEANTIASTGFAVLTAELVPFTFLYFATTTDDFVAYLTNNATGAAYPAVTAPTFEKADLLVPSAALLKQFGDATIPMAEEIHTLQRQIQNLRRTRDLLLPRLLSGQIIVEGEAA